MSDLNFNEIQKYGHADWIYPMQLTRLQEAAIPIMCALIRVDPKTDIGVAARLAVEMAHVLLIETERVENRYNR